MHEIAFYMLTRAHVNCIFVLFFFLRHSLAIVLLLIKNLYLSSTISTIRINDFKMKSLLIFLCFSANALASVKQATELVEIFRTNYSQSTLSAAFGGVQVSYGNQNVILWENGEGIDVVYPEGR